jgi:hypothetical protein
VFEATRSQELASLLIRLADLHMAAAQASGNTAADRIAAELGIVSGLSGNPPHPDLHAQLQAAVDDMLDAVQAQDRVHQTLQLARHIAKASLAPPATGEQSDETLLADLARRSKSVQPDLEAEFAHLVEAYLARRDAR